MKLVKKLRIIDNNIAELERQGAPEELITGLRSWRGEVEAVEVEKREAIAKAKAEEAIAKIRAEAGL